MKLTPQIIQKLTDQVGPGRVLNDELSLALYAYDCSPSRTRPDGVVLIEKASQVGPVLRVLAQYRIPFVPRAGATNHAGSCVPLKGGVILNLTALNRILQINTREGFAVVEPGVITGDLQAALAPLGYFYAPDPASAQACTLGGNLAQNASGARGMKYGGTLAHVLAAHVVLPDGEELSLTRAAGGPDLIGLFTGSEGTLGVITQLTVRILPVAKHIQTFLVTFPSLQSGVQAVSDLTARGIIPRCVEAMDKTTTRAVEEFAHAGYPTDAEALLILELEGTPARIQKEKKLLESICHACGALHITQAHSEQERQNLWRGRRSAFAAMARLTPNVLVGDGTVPRSRLPQTLARVQQIIKRANLKAGLLFHAGDGNFHPHLLFDGRNPLQARLATRAQGEILKACIDEQGTLSGEHGVGVEKRAAMAYQYDEPTLAVMQKIKRALDPYNLANPLKILPYRFAEKARASLPVPAPVQALQQQQLAWQKEHVPYAVVGTNTRLKTKQVNLLSAAGLDKIIEIDTANYTVTAQSGVRLSALASALKKAGVYSLLPAGKGTLGGLFCSGVLPAFYNHVLGAETLLPDGTYARYGGKLMKNAAGYPLTRLWAGSQGRLGLVVQLTFKVFATPQKTPKPFPFVPAQPNEIYNRLLRAFAEGKK